MTLGPARRGRDGASRGEEDRARAEERAAEAGPRTRAPTGPFVLLGVLAAIGCLQVLFMIGLELNRTVQHHEAIRALEAEVAALQREAQGLRATIEHGQDPAFREQLARRQGFMYPFETRVIVMPQGGP